MQENVVLTILSIQNDNKRRCCTNSLQSGWSSETSVKSI